jgi:hypothetical protein
MSGQLGLLITLRLARHGDDHVELRWLDWLPGAAFQRIPVPIGAGHRMITDEKEQVGNRLLQGVRITGRCLDLIDQISAQPPVDVGVRIGITPAQVCF